MDLGFISTSVRTDIGSGQCRKNRDSICSSTRRSNAIFNSNDWVQCRGIKIGKLDIKCGTLEVRIDFEICGHTILSNRMHLHLLSTRVTETDLTLQKIVHTIVSHEEMVGKPFLILANKQDLPGAASKEEISKVFQLESIKSSEWYIIECSALKNKRAKIGFEWLGINFKKITLFVLIMTHICFNSLLYCCRMDRRPSVPHHRQLYPLGHLQHYKTLTYLRTK